MTTDIPQRRRPQQGIAQGMDQHIAIRVGGKGVAVGNGDTAEHQVVAVGKGVYIVAVSDTHRLLSCLLQKKGGQRQILRAGDLDIIGVPLDQPRRPAAMLEGGGLVRHLEAIGQRLLQ